MLSNARKPYKFLYKLLYGSQKLNKLKNHTNVLPKLLYGSQKFDRLKVNHEIHGFH